MLPSPCIESPAFDVMADRPKKHILLVDDDKPIRECMRQFLELQGFHCTVADNGATALKTLTNHSFSLIITDNQMPVMDGITFLETLYAESQQPVPVIIVTGHLTSSLVQRAHRIGVTSIFEKPCAFETLSDAIAQVIET